MKWQGPVYEGLKSFFQKKEDYETYSIPFPEILTDPVKTVERIKKDKKRKQLRAFFRFLSDSYKKNCIFATN